MVSMATQSERGAARFLTAADCADILNLELGEVMSLVESGELPAIRVGLRWRVERDVLESYIAGLYEEQRRRSLWEQSDFSSLVELGGGRVQRPNE